MRVYCEDCVRYNAICHKYASCFIGSPVIKVTYTTGCIMENQNGTCSAYKRKWWKFCITKGE